MELSKKEFESKCIEVIEQIVLLDKNQTRLGAVAVAEKMLSKAKSKYPQGNVVVDIYKKVHEEFSSCSDQEYSILKKQLFSTKD